MCARVLQSKNVWKEKLKENKSLKRMWKEKKNEKHEKKRIGKQNKKRTKKVGTNGLEEKKRTKKLGTNGLEKKRSKWTTQVENMSSIQMCNCEPGHLEVWTLCVKLVELKIRMYALM